MCFQIRPSNLPKKTLRLIFDAVGQSEKNEIISLLVQENKEKILLYSNKLMQEQALGLTLQNIKVSTSFDVEVTIVVNYSRLVKKLLPIVQEKIAQNPKAANGVPEIVLNLSKGHPDLLLKLVPQATKDHLAAYLINSCSQTLLSFAMKAAKGKNICLVLSDLTAKV